METLAIVCSILAVAVALAGNLHYLSDIASALNRLVDRIDRR
jgi:hypothetical protein